MSTTESVPKAAIGHDDYSLARVPLDARYSWVSVAFQRLGQLSALAQFFLAAMIGLRMDFWPSMLAITIGAVLLELVTIFVGFAGQREGLSTSLLGRWTGFGVKGSALVGIAIALSLTGWFAVQNGVFAAGMTTLMPAIPFPVWALVGGIVVTIIVVYGFKWMNYVAYVTVPSFIILCIWALSATLGRWDLGKLMTADNPELIKVAPLDMAGAITIVAGGFIVGALFTPDCPASTAGPATSSTRPWSASPWASTSWPWSPCSWPTP